MQTRLPPTLERGERRPAVVYHVDAGDRITYVNDAWDHSARWNDACRLDRAAVLGRRLWSFVQGSHVVTMQRALLAAVRESGRATAYSYRCDAGDRRRYMELIMWPHGDGSVAFESRLVSQEFRLGVRVVDGAPWVNDTGVWPCARCDRVHGPGEVGPLDEMVASLRRHQGRAGAVRCVRCLGDAGVEAV